MVIPSALTAKWEMLVLLLPTPGWPGFAFHSDFAKASADRNEAERRRSLNAVFIRTPYKPEAERWQHPLPGHWSTVCPADRVAQPPAFPFRSVSGLSA